METKTPNQIFGANLKKFRKISGLTGEALGYAIGYRSSGRISQIESGNSEMPIDKKIKAAEILNVNPEVLSKTHEMSDDEAEIYVYLGKIFAEKPDSHHIKSLKTFLKSIISE